MGESPELDEERAPGKDDFGLSVSTFLDLPYKQARGLVVHRFEAHYLPHILERAGGDVSKAARERAIERSHLTELPRRHALS